jgi:hypothetical protein
VRRSLGFAQSFGGVFRAPAVRPWSPRLVHRDGLDDVQGCAGAGLQECRAAGVPELRWPEIVLTESASSLLPLFESSATPTWLAHSLTQLQTPLCRAALSFEVHSGCCLNHWHREALGSTQLWVSRQSARHQRTPDTISTRD